MEPTPPPPLAGEACETVVVALAAAGKEEENVKRARRRSRYLSPPYTGGDDGDEVTAEQTKQEEEEEEASLLLQLRGGNVPATAADLLSALLQSAASAVASPPSPPSPSVDAGLLLRFFSVYRTSLLAKAADRRHDAAAGHMVVLRARDAMAAAAKKQGEDTGHASAHPIRGPASATEIAAALQAGRKRKKKNPSTDCTGRSTAATAAGADSTPKTKKKEPSTGCTVRSTGGAADSTPKMKKTWKKHGNNFGNPAAAAPKLPLTDMRKNLEMMIRSMSRPSSFGNGRAHDLVGEMQGLLAKVDKVLSARPSATTGHHH